jgi:Na+-driven multidrug efflux pump
MIITSLGVCGLRIIWLFTAVPIWPSVRMVIISYPMTWSVTSLLFIFYYRYYVKKNGISVRRRGV